MKDADNKRRLTLIHKATDGDLSPEEEAELERLQAEADRALAPIDNLLLEQLERKRRQAEDLIRDTKDESFGETP